MMVRTIAGRSVRPVGLGCMNLSHAYGTPPDREEGARLLHAALDAGYDFLDTAALYGFGGNETLIGETLAGRRGEYLLASKCGMAGVDGKRVIDGRPATITATVEASLRRLNTDVIDLLYLHRRDFAVPIEETVGAMAALVQAGKVRMIGRCAPRTPCTPLRPCRVNIRCGAARRNWVCWMHVPILARRS
jgi:aryl-alcohol dehydrogenase-like predicted oxidoreductase